MGPFRSESTVQYKKILASRGRSIVTVVFAIFHFLVIDPKITFKGQKTLFVFRRNSGEAAGSVKTTLHGYDSFGGRKGSYWPEP